MTQPHTPTPTPPRLTGAALPDGVALLSGADSAWALLGVQGVDATRFLQSQLSNDFALLQARQARLAAFCTPKGRMLASFVALRTAQSAEAGNSYLLLCRRDLLEATLKRLRLFVLRSKLTLEDASPRFAIYGLLGHNACALWPDATPTTPWQHRQQPLAEGGVRHLVSLYPAAEEDGALPRLLCVQPAGTPPPTGQTLPATMWELAEVRSGVATISQATSEAFVPQMLNYESVGGISFKKGCYPGQEVVARSQFRGAIKRRGCVTAGLTSAALPQPGQDVWRLPTDAANDASSAPEPCGQIAQVAATDQGFALIASVQTSALEDAARGHCQLRAATPNGADLTLLPLPYRLAEDI